MKKFVVSISAIVICVAACLGLASCDNGQKLPKDNALPNLADCEIGDKLPINPSCEFSYVVNDTCTVKITSLSATLTAKNTISKGDTIGKPFSPYVITIKAEGYTDPSNSGNRLGLLLQYGDALKPALVQTATVDNAGKIIWEVEQSVVSLSTIYFSYIM